MKTTLIILAAGKSTRYGRLKQFETIGPSNVTLMEYSIYDALQAGFTNIIIVITEDTISYFQNIKKRIKRNINIDFVLQDHKKNKNHVNYKRIKPWGTGHALLSCKNICTNPFIVINSDDYYGKKNFKNAIKFFKKNKKSYLIIPYYLKNTLLENRKENRGICEFKDNLLINIYEEEGLTKENTKNKNPLVSMNFWGFQTTIFPYIEDLFQIFLKNHKNPTDEFYLSSVVQHLIQHNKNKIYSIHAEEKWHGITYKKDKEHTHHALCKLNYPTTLWN